MKSSIKEIRERLRKYGLQKYNAARVTGCCKIYIDGSTATKSGITERECRDIANEYPGATYDFYPGQTCKEARNV
jgi:hypothetical protein